jgi:hypothetical protein
MIIRQRDIVEIAFYTGAKPEPHPAVVISVDDIFEMEGFFMQYFSPQKTYSPILQLKLPRQ